MEIDLLSKGQPKKYTQIPTAVLEKVRLIYIQVLIITRFLCTRYLLAWPVSSHLAPFSQESRKRFGAKKPFMQLLPAYHVLKPWSFQVLQRG